MEKYQVQDHKYRKKKKDDLALLSIYVCNDKGIWFETSKKFTWDEGKEKNKTMVQIKHLFWSFC